MLVSCNGAWGCLKVTCCGANVTSKKLIEGFESEDHLMDEELLEDSIEGAPFSSILHIAHLESRARGRGPVEEVLPG